MEEDFIRIKKSVLAFLVFVIVSFLAGMVVMRVLYQGGLTENKPKVNETDCKNFCSYANAEFTDLDENGHCLCDQRRVLYDNRNNKTIIVTRTIDAGIIKGIEIVEGVPEQGQQGLIQGQ